MTARATIDEIIELMGKGGLEMYLSFRFGKEIVYTLVHPKTLFTLHMWELKEGGISGFFEKETEEHLLQLAFKKFVIQAGMTYDGAQRKARNHFQEFIGGANATEASGE